MKIKIGNLTYTVEYASEEHMSDANLFGDCNHQKQRIRISKGISKEQEKETLIHEILHCIYNHYGLTGDDCEEKTVTFLAKGLSQVLADNKELAL